jgi:hypothetical protein
LRKIIYHTWFVQCCLVHLAPKLNLIAVMIIAITSVLLSTTIDIEFSDQVVEAQDMTNTTDSVGDASQILDNITSMIANRITYQ